MCIQTCTRLKQKTYLALSISSALLLYGCPEDPEPQGDPVEPKITISSALPCVEPILPVFTQEQGEPPTIGTIEVAVTGVSASESNGLEVKLFYESERLVGCFLSSVAPEGGDTNYRCSTLESSALTLRARRSYDNIYCLSPGKMELYAEITLPNGSYKRSEPFEVVCTTPDIFASSCTPVDQAMEDMGSDMGSDMGLDIGPAPIEPVTAPSQWSISYSSPESATQLSVQGSVSDAPHVGHYDFKVIDQTGAPLAGVPVRFFLNSSALDSYPICDISCAQERDAIKCDEREACVWDLTLVSYGGAPGGEGSLMGNAEGGAMSGTEGGTEGGTAGGDEVGGETSGRAPTPQPIVGACRVSDSWVGDERCARAQDRCEANYCLPSRNPGAVGRLPVSIDPFYALSDQDGQVSVSMVAQEEPGVFSIRAEAYIDDAVQVANTPNITVLHEIATQDSLSFSCSPSVVNSFSTHDAPNELNPNGYHIYQLNDPISTCTLQVGDRFSGPIRGSSVFFLSESGTITQSAVTDELGRAAAELQNSAPTPANVSPKTYSSPYIDHSGDGRCQPEESLTGTCANIEEQRRTLSWQFGSTGAPRSMELNPRDGLTKVVAFTQGEAPFIDYILEGNDPITSVVGLYQPEYDFVPLHSEPFVDSNDNQEWDLGERFFDANRNGVWDLDVFGRAERADELRCAYNNLKAISAVSGDESPALIGCTNDLNGLIISLAADNPPNLNAYIWTSAQLLNVGLPVTSAEPPLSLVCENETKCVKASDYINNFTCGPLPPTADLALDVTDSSQLFNLKVALKDAHLNCLGLTGVSYNVSSSELLEAPPLTINPLTETSLPWGEYSPSYQDCFSPILSGVPLARDLVTGALAEYVEHTNQAPPFLTEWTSARLTVNLEVPDHRVVEGGTFSYEARVNVAICRNQ